MIWAMEWWAWFLISEASLLPHILAVCKMYFILWYFQFLIVFSDPHQDVLSALFRYGIYLELIWLHFKFEIVAKILVAYFQNWIIIVKKF